MSTHHVCELDERYSPPIAHCWREHKPEILAWVNQFKPGMPFAWPDDGLARKPWHYEFHVAWVAAWNAENRETECVAFINRWLNQ